MVWNKTPDTIVSAIQQELYNIHTTYKELSDKYQVSYWLVGEIARAMPEELGKARRSAACARKKHGEQNPMFGKTREKHHNASIGPVMVAGYKTVFAPPWWEGKYTKGGRVYEHQVVYCEAHGLTCVPQGHVIHHLDHDKHNNSIGNLELMSRREHMSHHAKDYWKVQRLSREGVGNSVPEAQSILRDDDIV